MKHRGRNVIPMNVPRIGNQPPTPPAIDFGQAVQKKCECGSEYFEMIFKVGILSKLASGNPTQKDLIHGTPVFYVCHNCGKELKPSEDDIKEGEGQNDGNKESA